MNRIERIFSEHSETGRKALMPFITAGDPDLETTGRLLPALERAGASVVEIGIPFSDPIADGPVIQSSMTYALDRGLKVRDLFAQVRRARPTTELGLVAMVSFSIVHRMGVERFAEEAAGAGFDGLILPDLPVESAEPAQAAASRAGLTLSLLIAPTTPIERARQIAQACTGFVYLLSRAGVTGEQDELPPELPQRIARLREVVNLPIAVGFGIARAEQVQRVVQVADAAIVGSALVRRMTEHRQAGSEAVIEAAERFTADLARGLETETESVG